MLNLILLTKLAAVLTVLYAGMNLHQLTSSHSHLNGKIEELRLMLAESEAAPRLIRLNLVFYVALPLLYLILLSLTGIAEWAILALALKFAITAGMDIRSERRILAGEAYTPGQHAVSRMDNVLNLVMAAVIVAILLRPA